MKKLWLWILVLGVAPSFVQRAAAQIVAVPPCVPATTCLLNTDNVFTQKNQFLKGATLGPSTIANFPVNPPAGTEITASDPSTATDCTAGGGNGILFPPHACYWNGTNWSLIGSGAADCPTGSVALKYFNGTITVCDSNANFDGNVTWTFENINSPGTITGGTLASTGPGGILDLQLQTPPTSVPVGHAYVYANSISGLLDCLKNGLVECFSFLQVIASGTASLSTSSVSSGGCNVTTVAATGITTSSKIVATPNVDPTGVTGYGPSASGSLYVQAWPTSNNINFKVCNNTSSPITPGALTLDYAGF